MNVLHIISAKSWGGGTASLENLCQEISKIAPEVTNILFCIKNTALQKKVAQLNYEHVAAPAAFNLDPRFVIKLISTCKKKEIDLIHLHGPNALTIAVLADKFSDLSPMVFSKKTSFPIKKRKQTLYKYNYHKLKRIFCNSEKTYRITQEAVQDTNKLALIYDGISIDEMSTKTSYTLREKYNIAPGVKIIGNIGNHLKAKDLNTFLEVANHLINVRKFYNLHFIQIGTFKDQTPALQEKVFQLNLQDHFTFTGYVESASNFIPQFDIFLLTSKSEGGPRVVYEAMYHEIPVISTEVGAVPEIIINGEDGFYAPPGEYKKLSEYLEELIQNPDLGKEFTSRSKEKLFPRFTAHNTAKEIVQEYKKVLALKG